MREIEFKLRDEHIKLGQLLKATDLVSDGVEAKIKISSGLVRVNGKTDYRRGKKIYPEDRVVIDDVTIIVK